MIEESGGSYEQKEFMELDIFGAGEQTVYEELSFWYGISKFQF